MTLTTVQHYGKTAQAMAAVYQHKPAHGEAKGTIRCTACGSTLRFVIQSSGISRGQCASRGCVTWCQ